MFDGPATFARAVMPASRAADSRAVRSGEFSGSAYGGQEVVTSRYVGCVPGQSSSTAAAASRNVLRAAWESKTGVSRTSTLTTHRSGTTEYPSPPLIAVTVSLAGSGKPGPAGPGNSASCSRVTSAAPLAIADGVTLLAETESPET